MDLPYSQQQEARRKNRSAANLQHLTLAPLSTRLPLRGDDFDGTAIIDSHAYFATASSIHNAHVHGAPIRRSASYIQGRSAPTTPRLLSKSPPPRSTSRPRTAADYDSEGNALTKSQSTTHLAHNSNGGTSHSTTATVRHHQRRKTDNGQTGDDWLMRAAVLVTSETREFKGQSWLTARASSTSLTGLRDAAEDLNAALFERELAREREHLEKMVGSASRQASRQASRRGSVEQHDVLSPLVHSHMGSKANSRVNSRANSRAHSRVGSRVQLFTPMESQHHHHRHSRDPSSGGYFEYNTAGIAEDEEGGQTGPDFVNLDEKLEAIELNQRDTSLEDEDHVRRLVKREKAGGVMGSWLGSVFGWSPLSAHEAGNDTDEDDDEEHHDDDDDDNDGGASGKRINGTAVGWSDKKGPAWATSASSRGGKKIKRTRFEGDSANATETSVPPPPKTDEGTWQDAAWLLSVASKVIL